MYNKYTLRGHIDTIEKYLEMLENVDIDYYRRIMICNILEKRLCNLKGYLSIPTNKAIKVSIDKMVRDNLKYLKK